ncbi:MAG: DUF502 domain-containing protein [Chitinophagaceae bacterium]|nr:DUF502 domain-containing protein [Chitinophagaceae bacterium]
MKQVFNYKKLLQYFLQGLLILAPVVITVYSIYWIISSIDSWLPLFTYEDQRGQAHVRNYGIGFSVIILIVILIGYFSSFFLAGRVVSFLDKILEKTPGIKYIYTTSKEIFEAFAGEKKKFTKNVLANIDDNDVWRVGFITQEDMHEFGLKGYVAVYVPMAYSVAGNVYIIPPHRVRPIENHSAGQTMKFAVSGGVTHIEEHDNKKNKNKNSNAIIKKIYRVNKLK